MMPLPPGSPQSIGSGADQGVDQGGLSTKNQEEPERFGVDQGWIRGLCVVLLLEILSGGEGVNMFSIYPGSVSCLSSTSTTYDPPLIQ